MAVVAVINNAVELAAEIEARTAVEQAIKEGRLPSFLEEMFGAATAVAHAADTVVAVADAVGSAVGAVAATVDAVEEVAKAVGAVVVPTVPSLVVPSIPV